MTDLEIEVITPKDERLGRQKVHDPRSRAFARSLTVDQDSWRTKSVRIYDPRVNPDQCHGECTGVAKAVQLNATGNRILGKVLNMDDAHRIYSLASQQDPWPGSWPPIDTGSSGLASAKAAQQLGLGGGYVHIFNGADGVVQAIQDGFVPSVGTWWYEGMSHPNDERIISPMGRRMGGHQYSARAYDLRRDLVGLRCWWGDFRDVWISRSQLNDLLLDGGDAHIQHRLI